MTSILMCGKDLEMMPGVIQKVLGGSSSTKKCDHDRSSTHKKQLGICIEYTYISELMLWLHQDKSVNVKLVKISHLAALQVAKYM